MNLLQTITEQNLYCAKDTKLVQFYHSQLIKRLDKPYRMMILRIIDEKDRLIDQAATENFQRGFSLGMALAENVSGILKKQRDDLYFPAEPRA